ncbi:MAG: response regulator [Butyrivibrio sp.]|nr:response regulator [Butyrivibrio sp.]
MPVTTRKKIVLLLFQQSIIARGMEKKLVELRYDVKTLLGRFDQLEFLIDSTDLFIMNLSSDILNDKKALKTLAELVSKISGKKKKMLVMGEKDFQADIEKEVPSIDLYDWLYRPVDMEKLDERLRKVIDQDDESARKKRILIVDDDPAYAKVVREWMKESYRVDIVTAGMQAISFLLKVSPDNPVDMILLDYEMPVVDGPQVLQMLRQDEATMHIPVVFLTGVSTKEGVARVMSLKPDGYILKTTTKEELLIFLHSKLNKKSN